MELKLSKFGVYSIMENINTTQEIPIRSIKSQLPLSSQQESELISPINNHNNTDKLKPKKWFKFIVKIIIIALLLFIIYFTTNYFYKMYKAEYSFDIKEYNLSEYFGNYSLGKRKKITWGCGFMTTCSAHEWQVTFKDFHGNEQKYKIDTASNFYDQISEISQEMIENEVKTIISERYITLNDSLKIKLDTSLIKMDDNLKDFNFNSIKRPIKYENLNTFFKKNYPKDINLNTFFTNNSGAIFTVYLSPKTTNDEIGDVANLLFTKSNSKLNLIFSRKSDSVCSSDDIRYFNNNLTYSDDCYDFYDLIKSEQIHAFLKENETKKGSSFKENFTKGEVIIFGNLEIKANLVEDDFSSMNSAISVSDDEKLVGIKIIVKNIGKDSRELSMYLFNLLTDKNMAKFVAKRDCEFCNFANQIEGGETQSAIFVAKVRKDDSTNLKLQLEGTNYILDL